MVTAHLQTLGKAVWARGGGRPAPNPLRRLLQANLLFSSLSSSEQICPASLSVGLCRNPDELVASCYTQYFTFWNGSGDPGKPTKA